MQQIDKLVETNAAFLRQIVDHPDIFAAAEAEAEEADGMSDFPNVHPRRPRTFVEHEHDAHAHSHSHSGGDHAHDHSHSGGGHSHDHSHSQSHSHRLSDIPTSAARGSKRTSESDMDKIRSTLKQFVRDWSAEVRLPPLSSLRTSESSSSLHRGKSSEMRAINLSWTRFCSILRMYLKRRGESSSLSISDDGELCLRGNFRVLVPGAGLARLAFEIASKGQIPR